MPTNQRIRPIPPINSSVWAFSIGGLVRHPLIVSYAELLRLPSVTLPVSVICADRRSLDTAAYTGVPLSTLFDLIDVDPAARFVTLYAYDGYSTVLPLDALRDHAVLAYALNDQPLTHDQGFPARLVLPGRFGYKLPKWITRVELTENESGGFWESRGFDRNGTIRALAEITHHEALSGGAIRLHGFAYGHPDPVRFINLRVDSQYTATHFAVDPAQTRWQIDWTPPYTNSVFTLYVMALLQNYHPHGYTIRT
jgi:DMSO/TMAO reductase YedYZ molybdopterin-dependent catalytic subunit